MVNEDVATDVSTPIVPPPPGFYQFSWPREDWQVGGDSSLFTVDEELPGWSPWSSGRFCRCSGGIVQEALRLKLSWTRHRWGTLQRR